MTQPRYLPAIFGADEALAARMVAGARLVGDLAPDVAIEGEMARQTDAIAEPPATAEQVRAYVLEGDHKYPTRGLRLVRVGFNGGSNRASVEVLQFTPLGWRKAGRLALDLDSWREIAREIVEDGA